MRTVVAYVAASAALLVALAAPAAAQQHEHGSGDGLWILHDVADDGRTYAGNLNHFGVLLLGEDGRPAFHSDVEVEVVWNGIPLFGMGAPSGHDYDAVWTWAQSFPGPGAYEVRARVPDGEWHVFAGTVDDVQPADVRLVVEAPAAAVAGQPAAFRFWVEDEAGALVAHTDVDLRVFNAVTGQEVFRSQLHTHDEPMEAMVAFPEAGSYTVVLAGFKAFPSASSVPFEQVLETVEVDVAAPASPLPTLPVLPPAVLPENRVLTAGDGPYLLHGTIDPFTSVGVGEPLRVAGVVVDATTGAPVAHVDFSASLTGPRGTVFESDTLHEYDGVAEFVAAHADLGAYTWSLTAERGDWWSATVELPYDVRLVPVPSGAAPPALGPHSVTLSGASGLAACEPAALEIAATDALGQPYAHSETNAMLLGGDPAQIVWAGKLHTHASGTFPFQISLPSAGGYGLVADVRGTTPDLSRPPVDLPGLGLVGGAGAFTLESAEGACPMPESAGLAGEGAEAAPLPALVAVGAVLAAVVVRRRR